MFYCNLAIVSFFRFEEMITVHMLVVGKFFPFSKIMTPAQLTLRIITRKREQSMGDDGSTLALKPMGRVNRSPKQRAPVAPQNGDLSPQKI